MNQYFVGGDLFLVCYFFPTLSEGGRKNIRWGKVGNCHPATSTRVKVVLMPDVLKVLKLKMTTPVQVEYREFRREYTGITARQQK